MWGSIMSSGPSSAVITGPSGSGIRVPGRGRILLRRRGGGHGIVARWPMIPAADVPDELVDQAMAVLQGKSREMVIRELQRTVSGHMTHTCLCVSVCVSECVCVCVIEPGREPGSEQSPEQRG